MPPRAAAQLPRASSGLRGAIRLDLAVSTADEQGVPRPATAYENLVLVAGHAVYVGTDFGAAQSEGSWFLEDYQKARAGGFTGCERRVSDVSRRPAD